MTIDKHFNSGYGNHKTSTAGPVTIATLNVDMAAGICVIIILAADNLGSVTGPTNEHIALTVNSNRATKIREVSNANGGPGNGATVSIWSYVYHALSPQGSAIQATFSAPVTAKAITSYSFQKAATTEFDIIAMQEAFEVNSNGNTMIVDTGVSGRWHAFIRGMAGDTGGTTFDTVYPVSGMPNSQTSGGAGDSNIAARGLYRVEQVPSRELDPNLDTADWASIGFAMLERTPPPGGDLPLNNDLLDDFNRANGVITAGAMWSGNNIARTGTTALGINSNQLGNLFGDVYSTQNYGSDLDLYIDVVNITGLDFSFVYCIGSPNSSSATGYRANYTASNGWQFWTFSGLSATGFGSGSTTPVVAAGDKIWLRKRHETHTMYHLKSGSSVWTKVISADQWYYATRVAPIGLEVRGSVQRLDNLRGGTIPKHRVSIVT